MVKTCWGGFVEDYESHRGGDGSGRVDGLLWYKDLGKHVYGEFSMAVIQANNVLEDQSQVESGPLSSSSSGPWGTLVGIYDGHAGPEASRFINDTLFRNLKMIATEHDEMSENVIRKAFSTTEEELLALAKERWEREPQWASVGSCCLVGIICDGLLYIANVGDSRVVLGRAQRGSKEMSAMQLSMEHNANIQHVREELQSLHSSDSQIVVLKHKSWRVKGIIQVSRSMGDAYLKRAEFNKEPLLPKFRLPEPFLKPILSSEPTILLHKLNSEDRFLIFGSDGLWENLSNDDAVQIVQNYPRNGIARRLVRCALQQAAMKREMRYTDLEKIDPGVRRHFHDDITVVVVYIDSKLVNRKFHAYFN